MKIGSPGACQIDVPRKPDRLRGAILDTQSAEAAQAVIQTKSVQKPFDPIGRRNSVNRTRNPDLRGQEKPLLGGITFQLGHMHINVDAPRRADIPAPHAQDAFGSARFFFVRGKFDMAPVCMEIIDGLSWIMNSDPWLAQLDSRDAKSHG